MVRPLAFAYPDERDYDNELNTYMIGDSLLVAAYADTMAVPRGDWYEWRTGKKVTGPVRVPCPPAEDRGGALYVKSGAVIPMWPLRQHLDKGWNDVVEIHVWDEKDGTFELYEDDGDTIAYRNGAFTVTPVAYTGGKLVVGTRRGSFEGMPSENRKFELVRHGNAK